MSKQNISFSKISKYSQCPRSYKHYYVDKLREKTATIFLAFGDAMDKSLNAVLANFKEKKYVDVDYKSIFDAHWNTVTINNKTHSLPTCTLVGYSNKDFVPELINEEDLNTIKKHPAYTPYEWSTLGETVTHLTEKKNQRKYTPFSTQEHELLNLINWLSMRRKAHLMLEAYVKDIIPLLDDVKDIQKKISLTSERGHTLTGFIDAVVKFKGDDRWCVLDNKTAAAPYDNDKVKTSQQLTIYCHSEKLELAAYAIMLKTIKLNKEKTCLVCAYSTDSKHKTCNNEIDGSRCGGAWVEIVRPEARTQFLKDKVEDQVKNVVFNNIKDIVDAINLEVFPQNLNTCDNVFGNVCPYKNVCWKNDSSDLVDMNE